MTPNFIFWFLIIKLCLILFIFPVTYIWIISIFNMLSTGDDMVRILLSRNSLYMGKTNFYIYVLKIPCPWHCSAITTSHQEAACAVRRVWIDGTWLWVLRHGGCGVPGLVQFPRRFGSCAISHAGLLVLK